MVSWLVAWFTAIALLAGCGVALPTRPNAPAAPAGTPVAARGEIVFGATAMPTTLNPLLESDEVSRWAQDLLFDGLFRSNAQLGVVGKIAADYSASPDGLIFTVRLNTTARWHDGQPLTIADALYTFDTIRATGEPMAAAQRLSRVARIEARNDRDLRFIMREPDAALPAALTVGLAPKHRLGPGGPDAIKTPWLTVGSGAFRLDSTSVGAPGALTFVANPTYYFVPGARIERLVWRGYADSTALQSAIETGDVDVAVVPPPVANSVITTRQWRGFELTGASRRLVFNTESPWFAEPASRRRFAEAIDRDAVARAALGPTARAARSELPNSAWARLDIAPRASPTEALAAIRVANGERWGAGSAPPLRIVTSTAPGELPIVAEVTAAIWRSAGAPATVAAGDSGQMGGWLARGWFDAAVVVDEVALDPDLARRYHTDAIGAANAGRFSEPAVDRLLDLGLQTTGHAERTRIYHRLQELLAEFAPATPLYAPTQWLVARSSVNGLDPSAISPLWNADRWQK